MLLFPRLFPGDAAELAAGWAETDPAQARSQAQLEQRAVVYAPTGGTQVSREQLSKLREDLRELADRSGFPDRLSTARQREFDAQAAGLLYAEMDISAAEAAQVGVWSFMGCVLLPDLVRWRFPGGKGGTKQERFMGGARGIRNTFGRLWWRAHLLGPAVGTDGLLNRMGEDELVQITERPVLAGNPTIARLYAKLFLAWVDADTGVTRSDLMREPIKRLRRLMSIVSADALGPDELQALISRCYEDSVRALGGDASLVVPSVIEQEPDLEEAPPPVPLPREQPSPQVTERPRPGMGRPELAERLGKSGLEVIDKREQDGRLWIVGGPELETLARELQESGHRLVFAARGAKEHRAPTLLVPPGGAPPSVET